MYGLGFKVSGTAVNHNELWVSDLGVRDLGATFHQNRMGIWATGMPNPNPKPKTVCSQLEDVS